jgi:putative ABC transport system permease protein
LRENLTNIGYSDKDDPNSINIYAATFEDKDNIAELIANYNNGKPEENQISYTDYVAIMMSSISTIINIISYVLIAFVSISLVVSSIMIGIITYISVLERTKEIGILRSIGASKKDISRVFNAETLIVGFVAGLLGILVTVLLNIPISLIIEKFSDIKGLASLPLGGAIILVAISMTLTLIAGLIPSRVAAKKDPVEALRSE